MFNRKLDNPALNLGYIQPHGVLLAARMDAPNAAAIQANYWAYLRRGCWALLGRVDWRAVG